MIQIFKLRQHLKQIYDKNRIYKITADNRAE